MKNPSLKILVCFSVFLMTFYACTNKKASLRDEKYGGTLRINASDVPDIIFPGQVLKSSEQLMINQIYIGLLKYNARTIEIEASLAKKWRVERNQTLYTFYLHDNAYFQHDPCFGEAKTRKIVARDVKYSVEQIARHHVINKHEISSQLINIVGSEAILDTTMLTDSSQISGIEVLNDTTIVFQLKEPDALFLHYMASTNSLVFPSEAYKSYGIESTVGSGAYTFKYPDIKTQSIFLISNPNFFARNRQNQKLPFIDTIIVSFISSTPKELVLFERGDLDMVIGISGDYVTNFLDKHINEFQSNPPYYIMKQTTDSDNNLTYNFIRSNLQNMEINSIGYFDFTQVYFKEPVEQEIKVY